MPYLNLDDNFPDHPKVDRLSDAAFRLHVAAMCYAAKHRTDGHIPSDRPPRLTRSFKPRLLTELIDAGVWAKDASGYQIHDFLDWNKSRAWWDDKRAQDAERRRRWREKNQGEDA